MNLNGGCDALVNTLCCGWLWTAEPVQGRAFSTQDGNALRGAPTLSKVRTTTHTCGRFVAPISAVPMEYCRSIDHALVRHALVHDVDRTRAHEEVVGSGRLVNNDHIEGDASVSARLARRRTWDADDRCLRLVVLRIWCADR